MLSNLLTNKKSINYALVILIIICLLPFFLLCFYIHPHYDDYVILNRLSNRNIFEATLYWYNNWTGRYSTIFVDCLLALGTNHIFIYRLYPAILMFLWLGTFIFFFKTVLNKADFGFKKPILFAFLFFILYLYKIPEITSGLYYVTCAFTSSLGTIATINLFTVLLLLLRDEAGKKKLKYGTIACLLAVFIGGSYEPIVLIALAYMAFISMVLLYKKDKNNKYVYLIIAFLLISGILLFMAPGNSVRAGEGALKFTLHRFVITIIKSIILGGNLVINTIQNPLLLLSTIPFIPVASTLYQNDSTVKKYLDINPILSFSAIFIIAAIGFLPSIWVEGSSPARITDQIYLFTYISWFLAIQTLVIYLTKKQINITPAGNILWLVKLMLLLCLIPSLSNKTVARAYSDLLTRAPQYNRQLNKRESLIRQLKGEGKKTIILPALFDDYNRYPLSIYYNYQDLSKDPGSKANVIYAEHWGIDSISVDNTSAVDFLNKSRLN